MAVLRTDILYNGVCLLQSDVSILYNLKVILAKPQPGLIKVN